MPRLPLPAALLLAALPTGLATGWAGPAQAKEVAQPAQPATPAAPAALQSAVTVQEEPATADRLAQAKALAEEKRPADAALALQAVVNECQGHLVRDPAQPDLYRDAAAMAQALIQSRPELLDAWRIRFEAEAATRLAAADSPATLATLLIRYRPASAGLEAGFRLAAAAIEAGRGQTALDLLDALADHPDLTAAKARAQLLRSAATALAGRVEDFQRLPPLPADTAAADRALIEALAAGLKPAPAADAPAARLAAEVLATEWWRRELNPQGLGAAPAKEESATNNRMVFLAGGRRPSAKSETKASEWSCPLAPVVADGRVLCNLGTGIVGVDLESGAEAWRIAGPAGSGRAGGVVLAGERAFAVLNSEGNSAMRMHRMGFRGDPSDQGIAVPSQLLALRPADGAVLWRIDSPAKIPGWGAKFSMCTFAGDPVCDGPRVYAAVRGPAEDNPGAVRTFLTCFDGASGRLLWARFIALCRLSAERFFMGEDAAVGQPDPVIAAARGRVFVSDGLAAVAAFSPMDGGCQWLRALSTPAVRSDNEDGRIVELGNTAQIGAPGVLPGEDGVTVTLPAGPNGRRMALRLAKADGRDLGAPADAGEGRGLHGLLPLADGYLAWNDRRILRLDPDLKPRWGASPAADGLLLAPPQLVGDEILCPVADAKGACQLHALRLGDGAPSRAPAAAAVGRVANVPLGLVSAGMQGGRLVLRRLADWQALKTLSLPKVQGGDAAATLLMLRLGGELGDAACLGEVLPRAGAALPKPGTAANDALRTDMAVLLAGLARGRHPPQVRSAALAASRQMTGPGCRAGELAGFLLLQAEADEAAGRLPEAVAGRLAVLADPDLAQVAVPGASTPAGIEARARLVALAERGHAAALAPVHAHARRALADETDPARRLSLLQRFDFCPAAGAAALELLRQQPAGPLAALLRPVVRGQALSADDPALAAAARAALAASLRSDGRPQLAGAWDGAPPPTPTAPARLLAAGEPKLIDGMLASTADPAAPALVVKGSNTLARYPASGVSDWSCDWAGWQLRQVMETTTTEGLAGQAGIQRRVVRVPPELLWSDGGRLLLSDPGSGALACFDSAKAEQRQALWMFKPANAPAYGLPVTGPQAVPQQANGMVQIQGKVMAMGADGRPIPAGAATAVLPRAWAADATRVILGHGAILAAADTATGKPLWAAPLNLGLEQVVSARLLGDTLMVLGTTGTGSRLLRVDARLGLLLGPVADLDFAATHLLDPGDGRWLVAGPSQLVSLQPGRAAPEWRLDWSGPTMVEARLSDDQLVLRDGSGALRLWRLPADGAPQALALLAPDPRNDSAWGCSAAGLVVADSAGACWQQAAGGRWLSTRGRVLAVAMADDAPVVLSTLEGERGRVLRRYDRRGLPVQEVVLSTTETSPQPVSLRAGADGLWVGRSGGAGYWYLPWAAPATAAKP